MSSPVLAASSSMVGSADEDTGASDDEMDWEEIQVPHEPQRHVSSTLEGVQVGNEAGPSGSGTPSAVSNAFPATGTGNIEITIKRGKTVDEARKYVTHVVFRSSR